jgi:hypothetical protein
MALQVLLVLLDQPGLQVLMVLPGLMGLPA